ncbi:MAG TPA: hypothetical protein VFM65_09030 [Flavobacteriaceae bacterium]|nr:hypothetical protein [Flavobacteriaceae bacterium]
MPTYFLNFSFLFLFLTSFGQADGLSQNYIPYHKKINRAETLFFMEGKTDSSLVVYDKVFANYDFIFVKDLVNAAQIAHFSGKPYKKYLEKGFEFGLKIGHLKSFPLFKEEFEQLKNNKELQKAYKTNRKKYLERIDFEYLGLMYELFIRDQFDKRKSDYKSIIQNSLKNLRRIIESKGFPGDKLIGISDSTIFAETGVPQLDLKVRAKKFGDELWYVETADRAFSAKAVFPMLVHHDCAYFKLKNLLWAEMKKGNIHPRDLGMLYDNIYRSSGQKGFARYCSLPEKQVYFRLNAFADYPEPTKKNSVETNTLRKKFYIVSLAVDQKKQEFEEKYEFVLFSGFWDCR